MDTKIKAIAEEVTHGSDRATISFPEVIGKLMSAGFEGYHADLVRAEKTYYLPNGESVVVAADPLRAPPATAFSAAGVEAAVRASQAGEIKYEQFCARAAAAGCTGYIVSLTGRRVVYFGRTAELHIEYFPGSRP